MNIQEWRARRASGEDAELPSGLVVKIKQVSVMDLAEQGRIPVTLRPQVDELMSKGRVTQVSIEEFFKFAPLINLVVKAAVVEPADLKPEELPYMDRLAIFMHCNQGATGLKLFRGGQGEPLGTGSDSAAVRDTTEFYAGTLPR